MTSAAFAPAHISGLFAVHDEAKDLLAKGSRGAGWSLGLGATAKVQRSAATRIRINGQESPAPITRDALQRLGLPSPVGVELRLDLPTGQGFGMSAAGTLAACIAACSEFGLDTDLALPAAHAAEVSHGGGLGDAIGSWHGSGEVRVKPGIPPHGGALRVDIPAGTEFLFVVLGAPIPTRSVIKDPAWQARTRAVGDAAVDRIVAARQSGAWPTLLAESNTFTRSLGLMPPGMVELASRLPAGMAWGQAMLGSTMWVAGSVPELDAAHAVVAGHGQVVRCGPDLHGARVVRA